LFEHNDCKCELIDIVEDAYTDGMTAQHYDIIKKFPAKVLILRNGVNSILGKDGANELYNE
jgi:hypothetical protein